MANDARKHKTLLAGEAPTRAGIAAGIFSVNDVIPVENKTEQAQVATAVAAAGVDFGSDPIVTIRGDAPGLHMIEYSTDGETFVPASGVLSFASTSARDTWTTANSGKLAAGDRCRVGASGAGYAWSGTAWVADDGGWIALDPYDSGWSTSSNYGYRGLSVRALGSLVLLEGVVTRTGGAIGDGYIAATVPTGLRPVSRTPISAGAVPIMGAALNVEMSLETNGAVKFNLYGGGSIPANQWVAITGQYMRS